MAGDYNAFTQGTRPGSVTTSHEVMILICWLIDRAGEPVTEAQLEAVLQGQELVNYFELVTALQALERNGQILREPDGSILLTALGHQTAGTFADTLPLAVRERASDAMRRMHTLLRREEKNKVSIEKRSDGYMLTLTVTDVGSDLLSLSIFMPGIEQCEQIRRRFLNDPTRVYRGILAILTGNGQELSNLMTAPEDEPLFE